MAEAGIAGYYDRLDRWNKIARLVGYGGGRDALTVHRALADPRHHNMPTTTRLHDILADTLPPLAGLSVLDAGCGLGGTMLDLAARGGGTFVGVTLSPEQARIGNQAAQDRGLAERVSLRVQPYDAPPPGPFDVVIAIESLAHSPNPVASIAALTRVMRPGGRLVVVDDMPLQGSWGTEDRGQRTEDGGRGTDGEQRSGGRGRGPSDDLETFKSGWNCPAILSYGEWKHALAAHGFRVEVDRDLTPDCRPRSLGTIAVLERLNRAAQRLPLPALRAVLRSHQGGLALERLLGSGAVQYRMIASRLERTPAVGENPGQ